MGVNCAIISPYQSHLLKSDPPESKVCIIDVHLSIGACDCTDIQTKMFYVYSLLIESSDNRRNRFSFVYILFFVLKQCFQYLYNQDPYFFPFMHCWSLSPPAAYAQLWDKKIALKLDKISELSVLTSDCGER